MIIPSPRLDDRTFEQLRTEAIDYVRQRGGAWDDLGDGDPGTVLLEAFAYLTEMLLYRVNRVPEKARREFLGLLGVQVTAPAAAAVTLHLERSGESTGIIEIAAGTTVTARGSTGEDAVDFITDTAARLESGESSSTVRAHQCEQVDAELVGISTGEVGQHFVLQRAPVVRATGHELDLMVGVEATAEELADRPEAVIVDGRAFAVWDVVDSFAGLPQDRRAVRVDRASGLVAFAPAVRVPTATGALTEQPVALAGTPAAGRQIRAWYRTGGGSRGNVAAGTLTSIDGPLRSEVTVVNPHRAVGGHDAEAMDEALRRGPELLHEPRRAVTADDFETLATRTPGVSRARAITEAEHWAHATAGTVEVRLVPAVDDADGSVTASGLRERSQPELLATVAAQLERQQPLGIRSVARWARYKEVTVGLRIVVGRTEHPDAVKRRVEARLRQVLSPTPVPGNRNGWPFGQALRASNVYNAVFSEPGVRFADRITMEVSACPDGDVGALAADRFQPNTWYVAQAGTLFRSENGGLGWEAMHAFDAGSITKIVPAEDRPGHVAVIVIGDDGRSSRLYVSTDCGASWDANPTVAFSWGTEEAAQFVRDVAWLPSDHDDLAVATDRGLYRLRLDENTPRTWVVDPSAPDAGCWAVAGAPSGDGGLEIAVAMRSQGGVWLAGPDLDEPFRPIGLDGVDIRSLIVERRNIRSFLWAPAFAAGDDPGTGCHRVELQGRTDARLDWTHLAAGWNGGICHDLAFLGDQVLAASEFNGVFTLDQTQAQPAWRPPSVQQSGLPLLENRRFQTVRSIDAANDVALTGTASSVYRTRDGVAFRNAARRRVTDVVTVPPSWLLVSGRHEVTVEVEAE